MKCPRDTILRSQSSALLHQSESTADQAISARFAANMRRKEVARQSLIECQGFFMRSFGFHRLLVAAATASSLIVGVSSGAFADAWPSRSIKLIVPFPAGGAADTIARIYGEKLSEALAARRDREQGGRRHRDCG
jgi:hypothetical protein